MGQSRLMRPGGGAAEMSTAEGPERPAPTTKVGSMGPDVILRDVTNTLRAAWFHSMVISPHDPETAYVGSFEGYVFKTTDGGKTWDESRLIIEPRPFYGDAHQQIYFGVHRNGLSAWGTRHKSSSSSSFVPRGATYSAAPDALGPRARVRPRSRRTTRTASMMLRMRPTRVGIRPIVPGGAGRVAGGAENVNFGIGLPGRAPRLQNTVRKFAFYRPMPLGIPIGASGINIKQTLLLRGVRPLDIRMLVVHPKERNVVYACTAFGLFTSYDSGLNWVRTFQGINFSGRMIAHIAVDPSDARRVLLMTRNGLYVSDDGGENYIKSTAQGVGEGRMNWVWFSPYHRGLVFACTNFGLLRSLDGGRSWDWIYFTTFPPARIVNYVTIDPFDKKTGYIGTDDGLFVIDDIMHGSLEDWRRLGGLAFTGLQLAKIEACPKHKGHLWAISGMMLPRLTRGGMQKIGASYLWETVDGGTTWKIIFSGSTYGTIEWFTNDPSDPDLLWITWSRGLHRMVRRKRQLTLVEQRRREQAVKTTMSKFPSLPDVMMAARRFIGVDYTRRMGYRHRSRMRVWMPRLDMSYTYQRYRAWPVAHDAIYDLPFRFREGSRWTFDEFRVMLTWNFAPAVFDISDMLFGRVSRMIGELETWISFSTHRFYGELQRLRALLITDPPKELRVRLMYKLRIEELESYLDLITGGYLTRYKQGDQPRGWDSPWFKRWPGVSKAWFPQGDGK
ncbi:MAG: hypothetical protein H6707_09285 [Deltaproteobacteria bacterium]|nr:hypothetical protein [Deltaproteobacteria bacterium]